MWEIEWYSPQATFTNTVKIESTKGRKKRHMTKICTKKELNDL